MYPTIFRSVLAACLIFIAAQAVSAQQWTRFRGPNGSGVSEAADIPAEWSDADYNWKVALPGLGHSSPAIWGDKVFVLSADPDSATRYVICLGAADGRALWTRDFKSTPHHLHARSSYASCSPAVDADHVYVAWSSPESTLLKALTHDGEEVWTVDFGPWRSQHGFGTSPIVYDDLVIITGSQEWSKVPGDPEPSDSYVAAVDRNTGAIRWKTPRAVDTASYSVPMIYQPAGGAPELICFSTAEGIFSLDPKTGRQNWNIDVFTMRTVSSPILVGGLIFGSTGSGGGGNYVVAVKPGPQAEVKYEVKKSANYVPTPVANGDLVFLWYDKGIVTCIDAPTGKEYWQKRLGGEFSGSPVCVGDRLYCISDDGDVVVLSATKDFQELGRHPLGEPSRSTPAIAGGRMYLRTYSHLISIGGKSS